MSLPRFLLASCALFFGLSSVPVLASSTNNSLPAVSGLNGKISGAGGYDESGGKSWGTGLAQGSVAFPITHSFGAQVDAAVGDRFGGFSGGFGGHAFWRDPSQALLGLTSSYSDGNGAQAGFFGVEGEYYVDRFTINAVTGYQITSRGKTLNPKSGGVGAAGVSFYPTDNIKFGIGGGRYGDQSIGIAGVEWQFPSSLPYGTSVFANGAIGDHQARNVLAGLKIYFGSDKTLIRRNREDDPESSIFTSMPAEQFKRRGTTVSSPPET